MTLSPAGASPWDDLSSTGSLTGGHTMVGAADPANEQEAIDAYFECITTCSLEDGDCVTRCVEVLRETV